MISTESAATRVNPARAGMILIHHGPGAKNGGKPRASGDDPRMADAGTTSFE